MPVIVDLDAVTLFPLAMYRLSTIYGIEFKMQSGGKDTESNRMMRVILREIDSLRDAPFSPDEDSVLNVAILSYLPKRGWIDVGSQICSQYHLSESELRCVKRDKQFYLDMDCYNSPLHYAEFLCKMSSCDIVCKERNKV